LFYYNFGVITPSMMLVMLVYIWWNISYSGNGNSSAHNEELASVQDQESASYFDGELFGDHATDTGNFLLENKY
jgi:hypothetical protein